MDPPRVPAPQTQGRGADSCLHPVLPKSPQLLERRAREGAPTFPSPFISHSDPRRHCLA